MVPLPHRPRQQLATRVIQSLRQRGDATVFLDDLAAHPEPLAASQLLYRSRRIAACWLAAGCRPGDTVLLFCELRADAVGILVAGVLSGVRVAVLEHTADLRELRHAVHESRPSLIFVSDRTSALAAQLDIGKQPQLLKILVVGDEFLGRTALASFNVFVRNARVPDETTVASTPDIAGADGDDDAAALLLVSCDAIGRFKTDQLSAAQLLDSACVADDASDRATPASCCWRFSQADDGASLLSGRTAVRVLLHVLRAADAPASYCSEVVRAKL